MRTIIEVPDDDIKSLDRIVEQQKKSRAAIIREAIRIYLESKVVGSDKAAFGIWKEKKWTALIIKKIYALSGIEQ